MQTFTLLSLCLATLTAAAPAQDPAPGPVRGRVVDARGQPVAGVEVAPFWNFDEARPKAYEAVTSAADGSFSLTLTRELPTMLIAYASDGAQSGSVLVDEAGRTDLQIALARSVRVRGNFVARHLGGPIPWTNLYIWSTDRKHRPVSCASDQAKFDLLLPPGKYQLEGYGTDVTQVRKNLTLAADSTMLKLVDLEIPAAFLALTRGKPFPEWHVTDARNAVNNEPTLADYRGKYLLIEVWGFW